MSSLWPPQGSQGWLSGWTTIPGGSDHWQVPRLSASCADLLGHQVPAGSWGTNQRGVALTSEGHPPLLLGVGAHTASPQTSPPPITSQCLCWAPPPAPANISQRR